MEFENLITSPFGLGERLILELLKRGESVFAIFPSAKDVPMSFLGKRNLKCGFLRFDHALNIEKNLPKRVKNVFHLFEIHNGYFPMLFSANTLTTMLLLDWARKVGVRKFLYLSDGEVYGYGENLDEDKGLNPKSFYGTTKFEAEILLKYYNKIFEIKTARVFFPFGKGVQATYISELLNSINLGKKVEIQYSFISPTFVNDVVQPLIALRQTDGNKIFNICGPAISIRDFLMKISGLEITPGKHNLCGDCHRAKEILGYKSTPIEEAIQKSSK
jgi:nucleoside-diphosphate-sugar epimerase